MNITVGGKTTLTGSTIASLDGSLMLDTGQLEVRDLHDYDESDSFGFSFSGIDKLLGNATGNKAAGSGNGNSWIGNIAVNAEGHDKQGVTHSVIGDGKVIIGGDENSPIMAEVKRDLDGRQVVTVDSSYGFSIDIPLVDMESLRDNATSAANFLTAVTTPVPDSIKNMGENAQDIYRNGMARGESPEKIDAMVENGRFEQLVDKMAGASTHDQP